MTIPELLADLMAARAFRAALREKKAEKYRVFEYTISNLLFSLDEAEQKVGSLEANIRDDTLVEYAQMGNKSPYPGVVVKEMTYLTYNYEMALQWAKERQVVLSLHVKAFEALAKADPREFPFVRVSKVPQVQIAQDLEKALKEGGIK